MYTNTGLCACAAMTNGCGNSSLTPSARISALNIVGDLLRKVGVGIIAFFCMEGLFLRVQSELKQCFKILNRLRNAKERCALSHRMNRKMLAMRLNTNCISCFVTRLWSPNSPPVGTLPKTRQQEKITPKKTAHSSTATPPSSLTLYIPRTSTKRESKKRVLYSALCVFGFCPGRVSVFANIVHVYVVNAGLLMDWTPAP